MKFEIKIVIAFKKVKLFNFSDQWASFKWTETEASRLLRLDLTQGGRLLQQPSSPRIWEEIFDGKIKCLQFKSALFYETGNGWRFRQDSHKSGHVSETGNGRWSGIGFRSVGHETRCIPCHLIYFCCCLLNGKIHIILTVSKLSLIKSITKIWSSYAAFTHAKSSVVY